MYSGCPALYWETGALFHSSWQFTGWGDLWAMVEEVKQTEHFSHLGLLQLFFYSVIAHRSPHPIQQCTITSLYHITDNLYGYVVLKYVWLNVYTEVQVCTCRMDTSMTSGGAKTRGLELGVLVIPVAHWLNATLPSLCPMQEAPVWEISGAEFTKSTTHTAAGISIRFPRVTRIRDDKDWKTATNLDRLKVSHVQCGACVHW